MKCIVANVEMTSYKFYEKYYLCLYIKFTLKQQGQRKHFGMFGSRYMGRGSFQNHFLKSIKPHNLANDVGSLLNLALKKSLILANWVPLLGIRSFFKMYP